MTDTNNVTMIGRLTRDMEVSYLNNGTAKGLITLAVNRSKKQGEKWVDEVSFFDWVLWGKSAESLKQHLTKGKQIGISGYVHQERWEKDGKKNSKIVFYCEGFPQLIGSSKQDNSGAGNYNGFTEDVPF